ncbi:MAG: PIN domain-containing protein [Candidatus Diapherotrites archaeon]|nr:PIN domain-containing protein [Candidatus Diapherotrites archaeon]
MNKRFYVDTCIWRDLLEERTSGFSPLGEYTFQFLKNCRKYSYKIVVSNWVIDELSSDFSFEKINELLDSFSDLIQFVSVSRKQMQDVLFLVNKFKYIHKADLLHYVISKDNKCVLVTRDKHFEEVADFIVVQKPEEVVFD